MCGVTCVEPPSTRDTVAGETFASRAMDRIVAFIAISPLRTELYYSRKGEFLQLSNDASEPIMENRPLPVPSPGENEFAEEGGVFAVYNAFSAETEGRLRIFPVAVLHRKRESKNPARSRA